MPEKPPGGRGHNTIAAILRDIRIANDFAENIARLGSRASQSTLPEP